MAFHLSTVNNILLHSFQRDIKYLETFGVYTALIPLRKIAGSFGPQYRMNIPLVIVSVILAFSETIWAWDNLELSDKTKNSDKIHYLIFHAALWISSVIGRLAFLISALQSGKFFFAAKNYVKLFVSPSCPATGPSEKPNISLRCRRKFKLTCLLALHLIYVLLLIEFLVKEFATPYGSSVTYPTTCHHRLIPCNYPILSAVLIVIFKCFQIAPQYFLTYFIIVMSDFLIQTVESFQESILHGKFTDYGESQMGERRKKATKIYPTDAMIFTTPGGNVDIPSTLFTIRKDKIPFEQVAKNVNDASEGDVNEGDYHEQFARLRELFSKFIKSIGCPLITSSFTDILILICLIFSILPQLTKEKFPQAGGTGDASTNNMVPSFQLTKWNSTWNASGYGIISMPNEQPLNESSPGSAAGAGYMPLNVPEGQEEMSSLTKGLLVFFHYSFQMLYECRAILIATIGSFMKYKINHLKDMIDLNLRPTSNKIQNAGAHYERFKVSSANSNRNTLDTLLVSKIEKWKWELRPLDMVTVDLSLIPTLLGTVMTYVVVLLQIRLSED